MLCVITQKMADLYDFMLDFGGFLYSFTLIHEDIFLVEVSFLLYPRGCSCFDAGAGQWKSGTI